MLFQKRICHDVAGLFLVNNGLVLEFQQDQADCVECVHVGSAYEATAEVLAAPTEALVIDLRVIRPRHARLVEIARQLHVELFGVGRLPAGMTAGELSGVRLVGVEGLAETLRENLPAAAPLGVGTEPFRTRKSGDEWIGRLGGQQATGACEEREASVFRGMHIVFTSRRVCWLSD